MEHPWSVDRLAELIDRHTTRDGQTETGVEGLHLARMTRPLQRMPVMYAPSVCFVARGEKRAHLGDRTYTYDREHCLVCSLTLPVESEIPFASVEEPFLGVVLQVDTQLVGQLLLEMDEHMSWPEVSTEASIAPGPVSPEVGVAMTKLVEMVDRPLDQKILAPGLVREIVYRTLLGPMGHVLRDCVLRDTSAHRVARVVRFLEENFERAIDVDEVARHANMSSSALHHHFKQATTMSPMQFVKKLRLHRARVLLLRGQSATEAAFAVGYASASQFSREFRRMFGVPPTGVRAAEARA